MSLDPCKKEGVQRNQRQEQKEIAKKYQIEGSNRKRTDWIVIEHRGEADRIELKEEREERIADLERKQ